jgi:rubrerythrin
MSLINKDKKPAVWIQKTHLLRADEYICSACGFKAIKASGVCPGCGARISKTKYDSSWTGEADILDMMDD